MFGKKEKEQPFVNNILAAFGTSGLIYLLFFYTRPFDWLSTSLWYDAQGFQLVTSTTKEYLGVQVSFESYIMNLVLWLGMFVFAYAGHLAGPVIKTSASIFFDSGSKGKRLDYINFESLALHSLSIGLGLVDSHLDFMWKTIGQNPLITESFYVNMGLWIIILGFSFVSFVLFISMNRDGTEKYKLVYSLFFLTLAVCGIAIDGEIAFLWESSGQSASTLLTAFFISYVIYGFLSEFLFVVAIRINIVASGKALGSLGFWTSIGWGEWAHSNGFISNDAVNRKKKRAKHKKGVRNQGNSHGRKHTQPQRSGSPSTATQRPPTPLHPLLGTSPEQSMGQMASSPSSRGMPVMGRSANRRMDNEQMGQVLQEIDSQIGGENDPF